MNPFHNNNNPCYSTCSLSIGQFSPIIDASTIFLKWLIAGADNQVSSKMNDHVGFWCASLILTVSSCLSLLIRGFLLVSWRSYKRAGTTQTPHNATLVIHFPGKWTNDHVRKIMEVSMKALNWPTLNEKDK